MMTACIDKNQQCYHLLYLDEVNESGRFQSRSTESTVAFQVLKTRDQSKFLIFFLSWCVEHH